LNYSEEFGHPVENFEVGSYEKRQCFDISPINPIVTENRSR
jgi:hypothetical protein